MFVTKLALEFSEQNFVTKLNHDQHLNWGLYCMSMSNRLPQARSQGGAIDQCLEGGLLLNVRKLFTKQALCMNNFPWDRAGGTPLGMDMQYSPQARCGA